MESETGVVPDTDFIFGELHDALFPAVVGAAAAVPGLTAVEPAPLAVQGSSPVPDPQRSWIDLSPFEGDEFGVPRAYVHLVASAADLQTWQAMDAADWQTQPFPLARPFPEWHRGLGTTYHESGVRREVARVE